MDYIFDYEIAAFIISIITLTYSIASPKIKNILSSLFFAIAVVSAAVPVLNISALYCDGKGQDFFIISLNIFHKLLISLLPVLSLFYILELTGRLAHLKKRYYFGLHGPYVICALLIITTPWTGYAFYVKDGCFQNGKLTAVLFGIYLYYIILGLYILFMPKRKVRTKYKVAVVAMIIMQAMALYIQFCNYRCQVVDFAASLSVLIMFITMQPSAELTDPLINSFNYFALESMLDDYISHKKSFIVIACSLDDLRHINQVYGEQIGDKLLLEVSKNLSSKGQLARIYGNEFFLTVDSNTTKEELYTFIKELPDTIKIDNYMIPVGASTVIADGNRFTSGVDLIDFMEWTLKSIKNASGNRVLIARMSHINNYRRRQLVINAVTRAIGKKEIDVYYQPIIDADTGRIIGAEALARLNDPVLGKISPGEFIPIAEQSGLILELGKCVREKVWQLLSEYDIKKAGLDYISVNLSSIECVQREAVEEIIKESINYGIKPELIAFEITETAAVASKEILAYNINTMKEYGFEFYLDDFGTGYSTMASLISLPFAVIKLEKGVMRLAMEPMRGDLVKRMIPPMKGYGVKIVVEGIESEAQAEKARSWGVDYMQGYLYSEPLPKESFIKFAGLEKYENVMQNA